MRGVVALAAAYSLPEKLANGQPFEQRDLIVFLTFCVILVTLVVQGLTLPALIRWLGLAGGDAEFEAEESKARRAALEAAIGWLHEQRSDMGEGPHHTLDDLLHQYEHRLEAVRDDAWHGSSVPGRDDGGMGTMTRLAQGAAQAERRVLIRLRDEGKVGDETLRTVERELDLMESRIAEVKIVSSK
jgi:CPA1 family monovalent cation:H+ antiporter